VDAFLPRVLYVHSSDFQSAIMARDENCFFCESISRSAVAFAASRMTIGSTEQESFFRIHGSELEMWIMWSIHFKFLESFVLNR